MRPRPSSFFLAISVVLGCTGTIDDPADAPAIGGAGVRPDSDGPLPSGDPACDGEARVGDAPLSRLTNAQLGNADRDLLAPLDVGDVEAGLVAESAIGGFRSNAAIPVSDLEERGYADQAARVAALVAADPAPVLGCAPTSPADEASCVRSFVERFLPRAFRRPVGADEIERVLALYDTVRGEGETFAGAASVIVEATLQSPRFLYRLEMPAGSAGEIVPLDGHQIASRLSFFLWDSIPDEELAAAAAAGHLSSAAGIEAHARRMLASPRAQAAIESFHLQWIGVDGIGSIDKDTTAFPVFDRDLARAMRDETAMFVDRVVRTGDGSYETLLLGGFSFLSGDLYALYGVTALGEWEHVSFDPNVRPGLLSQASFLAAHAHPDQTSPVHRGRAIRESFFCETLPAPPPDVDDTPPDPDPSLTTRERFAAHDEVAACAGCHQLMDPIGLAFEAFDAVGQHRTMEAGRPVDTTGAIVGTDVEGPIDGVRELSERLVESGQARECLVRNWYRFALGRLESEAELCSLVEAYETFERSGRDVRELIVAITRTDAFRLYRIPEVSP